MFPYPHLSLMNEITVPGDIGPGEEFLYSVVAISYQVNLGKHRDSDCKLMVHR